MRKYLVFFIILFAPIFATSAYAAVCSYPTYDCNSSSQEVHAEFNCATTSYICFKGIKYATCSSCQTGFSMYQGSYTVSSSNCTIPYNSCTATRCNGCTEGISYTNWKRASTGYQTRTKTTCNATTNYICQNTTEVRCLGGYYGNPVVNGTSFSGCKQCPTVESTGIKIVENPYDYTTVSSAPGSTDITDCFARNCSSDCLVIMNDGTGNFYWDWNVDTAGEGICYYGN